MKTLYTVIAALTVAMTFAVAPEPASAQSNHCNAGLPDWANAAFNPRLRGLSNCGKTTVKNSRSQSLAAAQARAHAKAQAQAHAQAQAKAQAQAAIAVTPEATSLPKPTKGQKSRVAAAAKDQVGDDADVPNSVRLAEPARQTTGSTSKPNTCRRYLASTGQTVEVPCAQ